jgi:hypothetical protein
MSYFFFILLLLSRFCPLYCEENVTKVPLQEVFKFQGKNGADRELIVTLPEKFLTTYNISQGLTYGKEFISQDETFDTWSEIITVTEKAGFPPAIKEFIDGFESSWYGEPLEKSAPIEDKGIRTAVMIAEAPALLMKLEIQLREEIAGKKEIVATKVFEGPFSFVVVQYSVRFDVEKTTSQEKALLKEKVISYLNNCRVQLCQAD